MNSRAQNQKLVVVSMNEKFIEAIDAALPIIGYGDRSSFMRAAIAEKLQAERRSRRKELTRRHEGTKGK